MMLVCETFKFRIKVVDNTIIIYSDDQEKKKKNEKKSCDFTKLNYIV